MIKSILGGKSKNLFDISKVITSNVVKRNGNSLICSSYGVSIGTLGSICPTLKPSDLITISFKCASEGAPSNFMSFDGRTFLSGATFLVSEIGLSAPWYLYSTDWEHRDIPNKTTYSDIQIELGSTATEYVPHELTSYKSIMKVSDVCQLVDKSKFTASGTQNGITWVSNGDGSITLNGTCTSGFALNPFNQGIHVDQTHFYYSSPYLSINYGGAIDGTYEAGHISFVKTSAFPTKFNTVFYIWIGEGKSFSNVTTFINIDDLTEMFGAGNEPKTVAEFKAKFPNDYYPYSPSCFVTSFDERMPCKTKNLINSQQIYQISQHMNVTIWQGEVNYVCTFSYELSMLEPNTGMAALFEFAYSDGTYSYIVSRDKYRVLSQITDSKKLTKITLLNWSDIKGIISNIQLEKGTKATDYVPYGYV